MGRIGMLIEEIIGNISRKKAAPAGTLDAAATSDFKLYDVVTTYRGQGVICSIEHSYEGMPYAVAFADSSVDYFEARHLTLKARTAYVAPPRRVYLAYNHAA